MIPEAQLLGHKWKQKLEWSLWQGQKIRGIREIFDTWKDTWKAWGIERELGRIFTIFCLFYSQKKEQYKNSLGSQPCLKRSPSLQSWLFSLLWTYSTFLHRLNKFWDLLLSCSHILAVVSDASITIGVLIFLWYLDFSSFV